MEIFYTFFLQKKLKLFGKNTSFSFLLNLFSLPFSFSFSPHSLQNCVREWCINSGAVDLGSTSIIVNSEDGILYRWNGAGNSFSEQIRLTAGIGEAYTTTVISGNGVVFATNDATLFAVGNAPPSSMSKSVFFSVVF